MNKSDYIVSVYNLPCRGFGIPKQGVRVTHISGVFAESSAERSQHANADKARKEVDAMLRAMKPKKPRTIGTIAQEAAIEVFQIYEEVSVLLPLSQIERVEDVIFKAIKEALALDKKEKPPVDEKVAPGDYVIMTKSTEWGPSVGERMWVDSVEKGHIMCRSAIPENRDKYIFWISNGDWRKE